MIEWIDILTGLAVVLAVLGIVLLSMVLINFARHALKIPYWWALEKKIYQKAVTEKPQEEKRMSKEKGEGVTFNDIFMFMIAVPLVLLWVGFAGFVIHTGLNNAAVLENMEAYTTLIAILRWQWCLDLIRKTEKDIRWKYQFLKSYMNKTAMLD